MKNDEKHLENVRLVRTLLKNARLCCAGISIHLSDLLDEAFLLPVCLSMLCEKEPEADKGVTYIVDDVAMMGVRVEDADEILAWRAVRSTIERYIAPCPKDPSMSFIHVDEGVIEVFAPHVESRIGTIPPDLAICFADWEIRIALHVVSRNRRPYPALEAAEQT